MIETLIRPSSNISACNYDSATQELKIWFKNSGAYKYASVPQSVWMGLQNSSSIGEYFHRHIKGRYADEQFD